MSRALFIVVCVLASPFVIAIGTPRGLYADRLHHTVPRASAAAHSFEAEGVLMPRGPVWTAEDDQRLLAQYVTGESWGLIGALFNRSASAIVSRWHFLANAMGADAAAVLRKQRMAAMPAVRFPHLYAPTPAQPQMPAPAPQPRTLIAAIMGDPPPGRSALDRRASAKSSVTLPTL